MFFDIRGIKSYEELPENCRAYIEAIEKEIEVEMKAELYSFLLENKFKNGVMYIKSMHEFVVKYDMVESVEEESLMRGFQRWRKKMKEE